MQRYEIKVVIGNTSVFDNHDIEGMLTSLGREGWRMVGVAPGSNAQYHHIYLERLIAEKIGGRGGPVGGGVDWNEERGGGRRGG